MTANKAKLQTFLWKSFFLLMLELNFSTVKMQVCVVKTKTKNLMQKDVTF